ncbi:MAG: hypothetical protein AAFY17_18050, partial [Cyanobacteria bacterium J06642_11]
AVEPENLATAWIVVDGQRLFEVAEVQDLTARQRANAINAELTDLITSSEPLAVNVDTSGYTPIIYNGLRRTTRQQLLSVTANDLQVLNPNAPVQEETLEQQAKQWSQRIQEGLAQARFERSDDYLLQAMVASLAVMLSALGLHYLLGYVWQRYVLPWLPVNTTPPPPGSTGLGRVEFSLARFSAQLLLLVLRLALWAEALWFVVRRF